MKNRRSLFALPYVVWMALFVVAPVILMVVYAFSTAAWEFTLENFSRMGDYWIVFLRSFELAVVATLVCLLIGYPIACLLAREGVRFRVNAEINGSNAQALLEDYDAVLLCCGATEPRPFPQAGEVPGVYYALPYLKAATRALLGGEADPVLSAAGKHVVVVGAGDTSADCIATAIRQGAASVTQLIRKPQALVEPRDNLWGNPIPFHDYAEDEAAAKFGASPRQYETVVDHIETNEAGKLVGVVTAKTRWTVKNGKAKMEVLEEGKTLIPAGLLLIASGFSGCEKSVLDAFGLERTKRGVAAAEDYATANPQVFVAGDMRRGPSLVVWAIAEGRAAAQAVDAYLLGYSNL